MPKRNDLKKIMVLGSGPIVIGQAAEFDYAGTEACLQLKEEGYEVVLLNSNPATIMTDKKIADKIYMEPLDLENVAKILRYERPDGLICSMGGQTGLNLGMQLKEKGILDECQVELLGTRYETIKAAEDRESFKELLESIGEPAITSLIATTYEEVLKGSLEIGFPVILRPAFTLGGTGGGFANNLEELEVLAKNALSASPVHQVLVEKSIKGYKEIEFEVIRDQKDEAIIVCSMENIDPVGIHTGDSMVVAPALTLSDEAFKMLETSAIKIVKALKIEGGCNVQFSLDPNSLTYYVIEVNPRVSRSSALASKASGFPIALVNAKIACGYTLDEITIGGIKANEKLNLNYIVTKLPRFPFDKFSDAKRNLSTQMKATGEVMSIGKTFLESFLKGIRSLENKVDHLELAKFKALSVQELIDIIKEETDERIYAISEALRKGVSVKELNEITKIEPYFLNEIVKMIEIEKSLQTHKFDFKTFLEAKKNGFADSFISRIYGVSEEVVYKYRKENKLFPSFKMIDTCSGKNKTYIPYFYSSYQDHLNESVITDKKKILVLGSGPIRIGQGIEFDYTTVHAIWGIIEKGYEAIVINDNPETVSTDYRISDKLYFEPLTFEDVMDVVNYEKPLGVIVALGGQTAINLANRLSKAGVNIMGTQAENIDEAEDRDLFIKAMEEIGIKIPVGYGVYDLESAIKAAKEITYPVLIRPSFVLGGRLMQIVYDEESLKTKVLEALAYDPEHPVLIDKYIEGKECEVDAICDLEEVFIPGIMEHIERTGVHSGDSISVYPPYSLSEDIQAKICDYTKRIGLKLKMKGLYNIQFIVDKDEVYVIEVNPRSSRTVPFLSKATNLKIANIATKVMLGDKLKDLGYLGIAEKRKRWYVKTPTFSFNKITGMDVVLSPEMKSTGEAIGYDYSFNRALYKSLRASGLRVLNYGTIFATIADKDKEKALPLIKRFYNLGFNIEATKGTALFLKSKGIKTRIKEKISEGSNEILESIKKGYVTYVINTVNEHSALKDGYLIRRCAIDNNVSVFTCLDTVKALLDVLEEITMKVSVIDEE